MAMPVEQMQMGGMPQQPQGAAGVAGGVGPQQPGVMGQGLQQPGVMGQGSAFYPDAPGAGGGMGQPVDPNLPLHMKIHGHMKRHAENIHAKVKEVHDRNPDLYYIALFFIAIGAPIVFYFVRAYRDLSSQASGRIQRLKELADEAEKAKENELRKKDEQAESWMEISQLVQKGQTVREKELEADFKRKEAALKEKFNREKEEIQTVERAKNEELKQQNKILISAIETNESLIEEKSEELETFQKRIKTMKERDDQAVEAMLLSTAEKGRSTRDRAKFENLKASVRSLK